MNQTSPMATATAGGAVAIITPIIAWLSTIWKLDIPPTVQGSLALLLVFGAHWLSDRFPSSQSSSAVSKGPAA